MKYDCLFVGNAIVDILADVSFEFRNDQGIEPDHGDLLKKKKLKNYRV